MNRGHALIRLGVALLALLLLGSRADAQLLNLGHGRLGPLQAGNDGVGGIEWHAPTRSEPKGGGFKQGNGSITVPLPKNSGQQPPSPITAAPPLARTRVHGRDGERGALRLRPLAEQGGAEIVALELSGALPGARVWLALSTETSARLPDGALLATLPDRLVPVGRADAEGRLVLELPAGVELDGFVLQALVRETGWASSSALELLPAAD